MDIAVENASQEITAILHAGLLTNHIHSLQSSPICYGTN